MQSQKERVVVISPTAGFGNRMRAMCAAAIIAKRAKAKLVHCWDGGKYDCGNRPNLPVTQNYHDRGFEFFFKGEYIPCYNSNIHEKPEIAFTEWLDPYNIWTPIRNYGRKLINPSQVFHQDELFKCKKLPTSSFLIETSLPISKASDIELSQTYQQLFKPQDRFATLVPHLPPRTIALHVRRGDFLWYFGETKIADDIIIDFLKAQEDPVMIFSDDLALKAKLEEVVQNKPGVKLQTEGMSPEEIAFLEFITMAACSTVIGTAGSSFSKEASLFGGKPYYNLNEVIKPFLPK